jgi:hypothetical protein
MFRIQQETNADVIHGPRKGEKACMRNGMWKLKLKISGLQVTNDNVVSVAQRWRAYRVVSKTWKDEKVTLV